MEVFWRQTGVRPENNKNLTTGLEIILTIWVISMQSDTNTVKQPQTAWLDA